MRLACAMAFRVALFLILAATVNAQKLTFVSPSECPALQFLDPSALTCRACGSNQDVDASGISCICKSGFRLSADNGNGDITCVACGANQARTKNGRQCIACDVTYPLSATTKQCTCPSNYILVETDSSGAFLATKTCVKCARGFRVDPANAYACIPCPSTEMFVRDGKTECECPSPLVLSNGKCLDATDVQTPNLPSASSYAKVLFRDFAPVDGSTLTSLPTEITIDSALFRELLPAANSLCKSQGNLTACQVLGNLCVLQTYNLQTDACSLYTTRAASVRSFVNGYADWPKDLPWLYYRSDEAQFVLAEKDFETVFEFGRSETSADSIKTSYLNFILAAYALNGTFLGYQQLGSQLQLCEASSTVSRAYLEFGLPYELACKTSIASLAATYKQPVFYDIYFHDGTILKPVPIQVSNYRDTTGNLINTNSHKPQLTRRMFMVDAASGIPPGDAANQQRTLRFASSVVISMELQDNGDGQIYIPLVYVSYADAVVGAGGSVAVGFTVQYSMSMSSTWRGLAIALAIFSAFAFVTSCFKLSAWRRRMRSNKMDFAMLWNFFLIACQEFSNWYFLLTYGCCLYYLVFFKGQTTVKTFVPSDSQMDVFRIFVGITFAMKTIQVWGLVRRQVGADIFFID
eukprot:Opistho-2@51671